MSADIKEKIATEMGNLFDPEGMVKPYAVAIKRALLKLNGHVVWHVYIIHGKRSCT